MWQGLPTNLTASVSPNQHVITFAGANTPGSLVVLNLTVMPAGPGPSHDLDLFWVTKQADTPSSVAATVAAGITALANPAMTAASAGAQVTITWASGFIVLVPNCRVYDIRKPDPDADLRASITGTAITLSGRVSDDNYGIYTNVNPGSEQPTFGVFASVGNGFDLATAASLLATSLNNQHIAGVTAAAAGPVVTITGAQEIECIVVSDVRVGQPDNTFCSKCSSCCDNRIGRIIDARLNIDTAIIQLDPGVKYLAEIEEIGIVTGTHTVTETEVISGTYAVRKRGRTTGLTNGTLLAMDVDGDIGLTDDSGPPVKRLFHRHYTGAISVKASTADPFSSPGDSGSAVVNSIGEVLGTLFGGGATITWFTPIDTITAVFDLHIATATALGQTNTVPKPVGATAAASIDPPVLAGGPLAASIASGGALRNRLQVMEREVTGTTAGKRYTDLIRRHFPEAQALVNTNRRVATLWQRNGGPQIILGILRAAHTEDPLPAEINGKPLAECLDGIRGAFQRYGSRTLADDLAEYGLPLAQLAGLTYPQAIDALRNLVIK